MFQLKDRAAYWTGKKTNKQRAYNMLPTKDSFQGKGHTRIESEGIEKDISCKW